MAISNMQQPQQIQSGIGSLQDPRQRYFLGKLVKKAGRAIKKVTKSPLGKMALLGLGAYGLGGAKFLGGQGIFAGGQGLGRFANLKNLFMPSYKDFAGKEKSGLLKSLMFDKDNKFSLGRAAMSGLGATALAAPFLMGGDDEEEEVDVMDPRYQVQRAKNYYSGAGDAGAGLDFMPQKKYVMQNFYAADGGRAGYANGMMVEDEEEEFIRSGAGRSFRQPKTFLNMGGGAGQQQAEQMLMMEYVKYKNKGGTLSFEQFVKAVMQQQQAPEGAGMEQPEAVQMAANGGRIGYAGGQLVGPSADGSRPGYKGRPIDKFDFLNQTGPIQDRHKEILENMTEEEIKELEERGTLFDFIENIIKIPYIIRGGDIKPPFYKADGGRIGKQEGGIMETEQASELIDMGGQEKDYRETGGFVDLGGKERADDVPARLSKNEFVFTADAVRNAGGGDIDKGAEVMENIMNNLEQGGEISEESQGLEGAQAMYEQQQMLQSRMI
jgi:hypothetical protein